MLNIKKWKAFLSKPPEADGDIASLEYCEQVVYRSIMCRPCVQAGNCHHCGCDMPDAILSRPNYCSDGKWFSMMSDEQWRDYKKVSGLKFKIDYDS